MATVLPRSVAAIRPAALSERVLARATAGLALVVFTVFAVASTLQRWYAYNTSAFDLAYFDQVIWHTAHGRWWQTSFVPYENFAGQHLEPILLLYAPAYRLGAGPVLLLVSQAVVCGLAGVVLYAAARRFGLRELSAAALVLAYVLNPYLHRTLRFDFHPEAMVVLPAFAAAWALAARRSWLLVLLALSTLTFKEDMVFVALAIAACAWIVRMRREALVIAVVAIAYTLVGVAVIMPALRDGHPSDLAERYSALFGGYPGMDGVRWALAHPVEVARQVFDLSRLGSAVRFLVATAPVLIAAPWTLLLLLPGLAVALLSSHPAQGALLLHYGLPVVPVALLGALFAVRRIETRLPVHLVAAVLVAPALAGFMALSPFSPLDPTIETSPSAEHREALAEALALIPAGESVSAQSGLLPRLSQRESAWEFPFNWREVDWVVVDRYGHRSVRSLDFRYDAELEVVRAQYERVYDRSGVEVLRRRD